MIFLLVLLSLCASEPLSSVDSSLPHVIDTGLERGREEYETLFNDTWKLPNRWRVKEGGHAFKTECDQVIAMVNNFSKTGRQCIRTHEMYGSVSPYTPREEVFTVRAYHAVDALLANVSHSDLQSNVEMFFNLADRVRDRVLLALPLPSQQHNQQEQQQQKQQEQQAKEAKTPNQELYFHLTEILCRKPRVYSPPEACVTEGCLPHCLPSCVKDCLEEQEDLSEALCTEGCREGCLESCDADCNSQSWLSHPIHADANPDDCDLLESGICIRRLPTDITAHMYLNEDFEGGEFFFTDDFQGTHKEMFQPTCGRVLAYTSGFENLHGVMNVRQGQRCHLTIWFTQDYRKAEELPLPEDSPFLKGRRRGPGRGRKET
eukprot:m.227138 g.227138  ORF g.227138 m.227138 type:complete len:375 (+) comp26411_c0_seq3:112-1236(+)